ncbi:MAG: tetratricopeptide repeat protein, partial [Spirulinaceae cyanobacterium]
DLLDLQTLSKELPLSHDEQATLAYKQFLVGMKCEQYETAISSINSWLAANPDDSFAWHGKGNALFNLGRLEDAVASYDKAISIKPDYHAALNNRGVVLEDLGRIEAAIASYDKAIAIKPDYHAALNNRRIALDKLKQQKRNIEH